MLDHNMVANNFESVTERLVITNIIIIYEKNKLRN